MLHRLFTPALLLILLCPTVHAGKKNRPPQRPTSTAPLDVASYDQFPALSNFPPACRIKPSSLEDILKRAHGISAVSTASGKQAQRTETYQPSSQTSPMPVSLHVALLAATLNQRNSAAGADWTYGANW